MAELSRRSKKPPQQRAPAPQIVPEDLGLASAGNRRHVDKEPRNGLPRQATGHKYQPGTPVVVRPVLELDRRVRDMLHEMHHDGPATFLDRDKAFDAQKVGSAQSSQHRHSLFKASPRQRFFEDQRKTAEAVTMLW